jgi:elongation factor G
MDVKGKKQVIRAQVPMAEVLNYVPDLTSITGGRGSFTSDFDHYEEVPGPIIQKIVEKEKKE